MTSIDFERERISVFQNTDPNERGWFPGASAPSSPGLALIALVGLCLLVAASDAAMIARGAGRWYAAQLAPAGAAPGWAFGVIWTALSAPVGVAAWLVWRRLSSLRLIGVRRLALRTISVRRLGTVGKPVSAWPRERARGGPLRLWGWQVMAGALWAPAFFGLHNPVLAGASVVLVLLPLTVLTARAFASIDRLAAWLLSPLLVWAAYALYLAAGFWWLNPV